MYGLMNPLCWSRSALINSHEQIPLFPQCCLDKLQFHLTLDSNFNGFHRTTVNTSPGIRWLNCKARSVFPASSSCSSPLQPPHPHPHTHFKSQFVLSNSHRLHFKTKGGPYIYFYTSKITQTYTHIQYVNCQRVYRWVLLLLVGSGDRIKQDGDRQWPEPCHNDFLWYPPPLSI